MLKKLLDRLNILFSSEEEERALVGDYVERESTQPPAQPDATKPSCKPFIVKVDDNYHFMNEDHRYTAGEFDTWDEALDLAKKIVDRDIVPAIESGCIPEEAIDSYQTFGEDPWISSADVSVFDEDYFDAWSYAEKRAIELYERKHNNLEKN